MLNRFRLLRQPPTRPLRNAGRGFFAPTPRVRPPPTRYTVSRDRNRVRRILSADARPTTATLAADLSADLSADRTDHGTARTNVVWPPTAVRRRGRCRNRGRAGVYGGRRGPRQAAAATHRAGQPSDRRHISGTTSAALVRRVARPNVSSRNKKFNCIFRGP